MRSRNLRRTARSMRKAHIKRAVRKKNRDRYLRRARFRRGVKDWFKSFLLDDGVLRRCIPAVQM